YTNNNPTDNVNRSNEDTCDRITSNELGSTIHRSVKVSLLRHFSTTAFCLFVVNQTGIQIRINRHLFTRHGIQCETCAYFSNSPGTFGDYDEVNHNKNH